MSKYPSDTTCLNQTSKPAKWRSKKLSQATIAKRLARQILISYGALLLVGCVTPGGTSSSSATSVTSSSSVTSTSSIQSSSQSSKSSSSSSVSANNGYRDGEYILGMDISRWSEQLDYGFTYIDTDGNTKDILALLKNHGVNYIRLRIFVDPAAQYGYASGSGGADASCWAKSQPYNGKDDIVRMAKRIKAAGMGFLLDFHYSDTWADPGKQVIPQAWRGATSIQALAQQVKLYTVDVLQTLKAQNALPDMVQVGNETTPGMLIHVPTSATDCWGNNANQNNGPNGVANNSNWGNLGLLLKAGIEGVKQVGANIKTVLHIENFDDPAGVEWWVDNALAQGVQFDVLGLSAYESFQGPSSAWRNTMQRLSNRYPNLSFTIAEFNQQGRLLNDIMREVPGGRGLGTFFWEPTESGFWGSSIMNWENNSYRASNSDFAIYDNIVRDYGLRKLP